MWLMAPSLVVPPELAGRGEASHELGVRKSCAEAQLPQYQLRPSVNPPTGKASCVHMRNLSSSHNRQNESEQRKQAALTNRRKRSASSKHVAKTRVAGGNTQAISRYVPIPRRYTTTFQQLSAEVPSFLEPWVFVVALLSECRNLCSILDIHAIHDVAASSRQRHVPTETAAAGQVSATATATAHGRRQIRNLQRHLAHSLSSHPSRSRQEACGHWGMPSTPRSASSVQLLLCRQKKAKNDNP